MSKPKNSVYIHLMNGKVAFYDPNQKLLFLASQGQTSLSGSNRVLVDSLEEIKKQQHACAEQRVEDENPNQFVYDYLRVRIA